MTPVERALAAAVSGWWGGLPDVGRWGLIGLLVVVLALVSALAVRRWRSRVRGAYQR